MARIQNRSSQTLNKAKLFIFALLMAGIGAAVIFASHAATPANFSFDVKKDSQSVRAAQQGTFLNVVLNSEVDKQLRDIKVKINGVPVNNTVTTSSGIGNTHIYRFQICCNGETKNIKVSATKVNTGEQVDIKPNNGTIGTNSINVRVAADAPVSNAQGGNQSNGTTNGTSVTNTTTTTATSTNTPIPASLKPVLTVERDPEDSNSSITVGHVDYSYNGRIYSTQTTNVKGKVILVTRLKRPATETYDPKLMHAEIYKSRNAMRSTDPNNTAEYGLRFNTHDPTVTQEGNYKIYTFKSTLNSTRIPNGAYYWTPYFDSTKYPTPADQRYGNFVALDIVNDNTVQANDTCNEQKKSLADLNTTLQGRINENLDFLTAMNDRTVKTYQAYNLAATNPIPDYDKKIVRAASFRGQALDSRSALNAASEINCGSASSDDPGAITLAYKSKLEELKISMANYRDATLDLKELLRVRIPNDGQRATTSPDGSPLGYTKVTNNCFETVLPQGYQARAPYTGEDANCLGDVSYITPSFGGGYGSLLFSGGGSVSDYKVAADNKKAIINSKTDPKIEKEQSLKVNGQDAVAFDGTYTYVHEGKTFTNHSRYVFISTPSPITYSIGGPSINTNVLIVTAYLSDHRAADQKVVLDNVISNWKWK